LPLYLFLACIIKFMNMDETLKADSSGLNGETDSLKVSSKSESPEKNLKSQSEDKTLTDNVENGDVDISSKEINDKDNSDSKSDNCDKSIGESTPKKTINAKAKSVEDKNSNGESENTDDKDKSVEEKKEKDSTHNSPSKGSPSKSSGCEKDNTENAEEKDDTTEDSEDKDTENSEDGEVIEDEKDIADKNEEESEKDKLLDVSEEKEGQISPKKDSKTLFSESESSDNDDSSSGKWEAKNIILYNDDEEKYYKEKKKQIEKEISKSVLCTACSKQIYNTNRNEVFTHPVLGVTICKKCSKFYGKGDFNKDDEGMDEYCRWCANGGELLLCDKCTNGFCKACVRRNLGRGALKEITSQDEWSCYVCSLDPLMNIRALHRAIVESIREKGPDSKSLRLAHKKKETPAKNSSHTRGSKKNAESPASDMTHSEDVKGLLILFQKELQKIEKRQNSKGKVSEVKFQRRLVRLIDLMQENFKRVKTEIEEEINDCDDKGGSTSEESESLQDKINKLSEKVKSGSKKRGVEQLINEEVDKVVPSNKKQKTDDENSSKVTKSSGRKKRTPPKKNVTKSRNKDVDDDDDDVAPESNKEEEEEEEEDEESQKISEKPKRLRVRSDLFAASGVKGKSKGKNVKGTGKKSRADDEDSDMESLPEIKVKDSDDSEEDTGRRRSGRKAQTPKISKKVNTDSAKRTSPKDRSKKKSEEAACIDLCSDSEAESPAKKRKSVKRKPETQSKQTRSRRK
ncbi:Transcriptional regulator ATRY, partial [Armadillidium nasatum]